MYSKTSEIVSSYQILRSLKAETLESQVGMFESLFTPSLCVYDGDLMFVLLCVLYDLVIAVNVLTARVSDRSRSSRARSRRYSGGWTCARSWVSRGR